MLELNELREALTHAVQKAPTRITLSGYHSSSTNEEGEMVVQYDGPGLYARLLRESLASVRDPASPLRQRPAHIPESDWRQALDEMITSWSASLVKATTTGDRQKSYARVDGGYLESINSPGTLALECLQLISTTLKVNEEERNHRNAITEAKAILRHRSPLSKFIGLITLSVDKVAQIHVEEL